MEKSELKNINRVELTGFAGNNAEVITLREGARVAHFSLATTENYKNKTGEMVKETTWHRITLWNKLADQAQTLVKKGTKVNLVGKLVNNTYIDQKGEKRYTVDIVAFAFEILQHEPAKKTEDIF